MNKEKLFNILKNSAAVVVIAAMFIVIFYQNRDRDIFKFGKEESQREKKKEMHLISILRCHLFLFYSFTSSRIMGILDMT